MNADTLPQGPAADPLTGIGGPARLIETCGALLAACAARGGSLALLRADVDGLRRIDDACGKAAAGEALARVARCIAEAVRKDDLVARLHGDEFAVVLARPPGVDDPMIVAERIVRRVNVSGPQALAPPVTVSIGIALWPQHGADVEALLEQAGRALLRAKREGGNCCCALDDAAEQATPTAIPVLWWGSEADLGVAGMDRDHRVLAGLLNALGDALADGRDEERLTALLDSLAAETAAHFAREEQWMDRHGYEDAPAHKAQHTELLEELAVLCLRIDASSVMLTMRYLHDWLSRHVHESDRRLALAMLARGGDLAA